MKITIDIMDDEVCVTEWDENETAISSKWGKPTNDIKEMAFVIMTKVYDQQETDDVNNQKD